MTGFLATMKASFPEDMPLPEEFERLFEWMESNDFVQEYNGSPFASLYPRKLAQKGTSLVRFVPVNPDFVSQWTNSDDPTVNGRLAPFVVTGGDGSYAALWRDDEGGQKFVHLGSTMLCTLTDNPVDFLRVLAIGYEELSDPEQHELEPEEVYGEMHDEDDGRYRAPAQFRKWVEKTFGVKVPATASEIVTHTAGMDDDSSDDPFWRWMKKQQGWREAAPGVWTTKPATPFWDE